MPFFEIEADGSSALAAFADEVDVNIDPRNEQSFWNCRPAFRELVSTNFMSEVGNAYLRLMLEDPSRSTNTWQVNHLVLIQKPAFSLSLHWSLEREEDDQPSLTTQGAHAMVCPIGKEEMCVDFFRLPTIDLEVFQPRASLKKSHSYIANSGQILDVDGRAWIADIKRQRNSCLLFFVSAPINTLIWSFDRKTHRPWGVSASSQDLTQIKVALKIISLLKHTDSLEAVCVLCNHPSHDVRWAAVQTLGAIDSATAKQMLAKAVKDPHPHVRAAAKKTLAQVD